MYMDEIEVWKEVCGLPKTKQRMALWLHLPRDSPSDIKESINANAGVTKLKKETSVNKFIDAMNKAFKPSDKIRKLKIFTNYYNNMKNGDKSIVNYINRFKKAANFAKPYKMDLPSKVKGLKLLHDASLSNQDMKLVLTGV